MDTTGKTFEDAWKYRQIENYIAYGDTSHCDNVFFDVAIEGNDAVIQTGGRNDSAHATRRGRSITLTSGTSATIMKLPNEILRDVIEYALADENSTFTKGHREFSNDMFSTKDHAMMYTCRRFLDIGLEVLSKRLIWIQWTCFNHLQTLPHPVEEDLELCTKILTDCNGDDDTKRWGNSKLKLWGGKFKPRVALAISDSPIGKPTFWDPQTILFTYNRRGYDIFIRAIHRVRPDMHKRPGHPWELTFAFGTNEAIVLERLIKPLHMCHDLDNAFITQLKPCEEDNAFQASKLVQGLKAKMKLRNKADFKKTKSELCDLYQTAWDLYRKRDFLEAEYNFEKCAIMMAIHYGCHFSLPGSASMKDMNAFGNLCFDRWREEQNQYQITDSVHPKTCTEMKRQTCIIRADSGTYDTFCNAIVLELDGDLDPFIPKTNDFPEINIRIEKYRMALHNAEQFVQDVAERDNESFIILECKERAVALIDRVKEKIGKCGNRQRHRRLPIRSG